MNHRKNGWKQLHRAIQNNRPVRFFVRDSKGRFTSHFFIGEVSWIGHGWFELVQATADGQSCAALDVWNERVNWATLR